LRFGVSGAVPTGLASVAVLMGRASARRRKRNVKDRPIGVKNP
jgi:hypothetical protein